MNRAEAESRLSADNRDITATLAMADNLMRSGDHRAANAYYGQVGRLAGEGVIIEQTELLRARDATIWLAERFKTYLLEGLDKAGFNAAARHPRFQSSLEMMLGERTRAQEHVRYPQQPMTYYYPGTDYCTFADFSKSDWAIQLIEKTDDIRVEAQSLMDDGSLFAPYVKQTLDRPQGDVHGLVENDEWSTCYLTDKGEPIPQLVEACPKTWAAMQDGIPVCDIPNRAPSVMLSLLRADAHIPAHTGMLNTRLVCHLPLIIPEKCALRCGDETRVWKPGEIMAFDDTVEHEALNRSDKDRLVLIFDVWRPEITEDERQQIRTLFEVVDSY